MPDVNAGSIALATFAALCLLLITFLYRLAFGWLDTWLGGRRADTDIKQATAGRLWAEVERADPPTPTTTTLPDSATTADEAQGVAFAAVRFRVGRCLAQHKSRADVIRELWGYVSTNGGGNYTRAGRLVDRAAQEFGYPRYPDFEALAKAEASGVTINSRAGSRRIHPD